uniref:Ubiquitin-like domain-containing protein n=1 Tax=Pongo abelii TaxID=9601 RepID=A0A8I5T369_PONAB
MSILLFLTNPLFNILQVQFVLLVIYREFFIPSQLIFEYSFSTFYKEISLLYPFQRCAFCKHLGGTIKCCEEKCTQMYHYPCAAGAGTFQDFSVTSSCFVQNTLTKLLKDGLSMRQIRFRFDGQPINETDTPAQLEMEDEDTIDVFQQQTGGVY